MTALFVSVALFFLERSFVTCYADAEYGYITGSPIGPDRWGQLSPEWAMCGNGTNQSPVKLKYYTPTDESSLGPLEFEYPNDAQHGILTLDKSLEIEVDARGWGTLAIDGLTYYPQNLHFHWPAEHIIGRKRYPLELHIVHQTADAQSTAVVAVLFRLGEQHAYESGFLDQFFRYLPQLKEDSKASIRLPLVTVRSLDISSESAYWQYDGSLTTPPCTEGVTWIVLKKVDDMSTQQLRDYIRTIPERNARPTQNLNDRQIINYEPPNAKGRSTDCNT